MKRYAVIGSNKVVENIIIAPSLSVAEELTSFVCIDVTNETAVGVGYIYDNSEFSENPDIVIEGLVPLEVPQP